METSPDSHSLDRFDFWIVSSLMQKAIRRGETATAQRAALSYYRRKKSDVFRRLMVVAVEDVGLGDIGLVAKAAHLSSLQNRRAAGDDLAILLGFVRELCEAPKDRSSDYLASLRFHPNWRRAVAASGSLSHDRQIAQACNPDQPLALRSIAAWRACRTAPDGSLRRGGGQRELLGALAGAGAPEELVHAAQVIGDKTRCLISVLVPVLYLGVRDRSGWGATAAALPQVEVFEGLPLYALDKHTRAGRQAIRLLAARHTPLTRVLGQYAPRKVNDASYMAAFYADAMPTARRRIWPGSDQLEARGTEADMVWAGVGPTGVAAVLAAMREALPALNAIRRQILAETLAPPRQPDLYAGLEGGLSHG